MALSSVQQRGRLRSLLRKMDYFIFPSWPLAFKIAAIIFAIANLKNLLLVWHYRVFRTFFLRVKFRPKRPLDENCLWLPTISTTRAPLLETDFNLHKSNSTYLSDVDISRANYAVLVFGPHVATTPWSKKPRLILGGVQAVWRKEIPPYKEYEMWTRVLAWDEKWSYAITHFVEKGRFKPVRYLQSSIPATDAKAMIDGAVKSSADLQATHAKAVYASVVSRVIVKQGRVTVKPEDLYRQSGIMPTDAEELAKIEEQRKRNLSIVDGPGGWDALHATFFDCTKLALGHYGSL